MNEDYEPIPTTASERLYVKIVGWLPEDFSRRYGAQMLLTFRDVSSYARRRHGSVGVLAVRVRMLLELFLAVLPERIRARRRLLRAKYSQSKAWLCCWGQVVRARPRRVAAAGRTRHSTPCSGGEFRRECFFKDLRYASRFLRKNPMFTAAAIVTLTLGIGLNTALFSVAYGILLRPLPYHEPDLLVHVGVNSGIDPSLGFGNLSEPEFIDLATSTSSFDQVAAYSGGEVTIGESLSARRVRVMRVTPNLLPMLGIRPLVGRFFGPTEGRPEDAQAIVLSYDMWQREFGADPNVVGRTVDLHDFDATFASQFEVPVPIVGVMPKGFQFPDGEHEAWVALELNTRDPNTRSFHYLQVIARRKPDTELSAAQNEVDLLAARTTADHPDIYPADPSYAIRLQPYLERIVGQVSTPLLLLMGAVGFVLLTACVNVANLVLVRGEVRKSEIAVRMAVGASTWRVVRQLLIENLLLVVISGLGGVFLAMLGVNTIRTFASIGIPRIDQVSVDGRVLALSVAVALSTGIVFGMLPALRYTGRDLQGMLSQRGRATSNGRSNTALRRLLVVAEIAFAVVLATGAGLMLRSIRNMHVTDTGFRTENVLSFSLYPPSSKYASEDASVSLYSSLMDRLNLMPGVASAGAVFRLPLASGHFDMSIDVEGRSVDNVAEAPLGDIQFATPRFFETLGLRLVRGRLFDRHDDADSPPVVIVSELLARTLWAGEDPIGRRMRMFGWPWMEVIGIVEDVRHYGVTQEPRPAWYVPHAQGHVSAYTSPLNMTVLLHTVADPASAAGPVRDVLATVDPGLVAAKMQTMQDVFSASLNTERLVTFLLTVFGALALSLAAVGVYGSVSLAVSQRTREIGLRMALGANASRVLCQTVREALVLAIVGLAIGIVGSMVLSQAIATLVFGIGPIDPVTYGGVLLLLLGTAAGASWIPARRASHIDPINVLRAEC